ncbi:jg3982 [Pararge aegeria aegeria]|uniref:Jg3982 protein n=1 Tax=Pararge aegeria aegeria TaxID=348720 RepID=A0A8S4RXB5_9NEOP|nr:jg3982 [Pararge aegeria aegeria]
MTVMTKPSMMLSKAVYIKPLSPLLDNDPNDKHTCVEEKVEIYSDSQKEPKEISVCWGMLTVLILFFCVVGAMMLYGHIMFKVNWFEGNRCTVPIIQEYSHVIRKRETEEPAHDYVHFSGNYVFEIKISNMAEILLHEKTVKQK